MSKQNQAGISTHLKTILGADVHGGHHADTYSCMNVEVCHLGLSFLALGDHLPTESCLRRGCQSFDGDAETVGCGGCGAFYFQLVRARCEIQNTLGQFRIARVAVKYFVFVGIELRSSNKKNKS